MGSNWKTIITFLVFYPFVVSSVSIDSLYLDLIHKNLSDFESFNKFYQNFLKDIRHHRVIDTVSSPIDIQKLRTNTYDEDYLKNACYETASDLLNAHGYNKTDLKLTQKDLQSLLPAILNVVENPGCKGKLPPVKAHSFFTAWIFGLILIIVIKLIHVLIFSAAGEHSSALTSEGISRTFSDQIENTQHSTDEIRFPLLKSHLWLGLGFNAFTCGIILGTVIYHLIPHIYGIPNEDFSYVYLLRGTVILCGIFLFFIVEKILRFRFKVDETHFESTPPDNEEVTTPSDTSMIQMAKMHGTFHVLERDYVQHLHPESPIRLTPNVDTNEESTKLQTDTEPVQETNDSSHNHEHTFTPKQTRRNLVLYHVVYDFFNDIIYGCALATAVAHDRLVGVVLCIMIFSEGFRRHSQLVSLLGRKHGLGLLGVSIVFLICGYIIGGILQQSRYHMLYVQKEYIYSIVYGALFYTALVTLIPELNDFGQHLQTVVKQENQTTKQRHLLKALILTCQILFLIIGVLIALILAIIWRYYHRKSIYEYVCQRDPFRIFCHTSS